MTAAKKLKSARAGKVQEQMACYTRGDIIYEQDEEVME